MLNLNETNRDMGYSSGMLKERVTILKRTAAEDGAYGVDGGGIGWADVCEVWAAVDWVRGIQGMREGALDVYGVVMVRMRWNGDLDERCRLRWDGRLWQIVGGTLHVDKMGNTIQMQAQELV